MPTLTVQASLRECGQLARGFPASSLRFVKRLDDFRIAQGYDFGDLNTRRHVRAHIQHRQVDHILQEVRDEFGRKPRRGNGRDLYGGLARSTTCIRLVFLCPFLYDAVARERLVRVVPSQSQALPELGMVAVPIMVETQDIPSK